MKDDPWPPGGWRDRGADDTNLGVAEFTNNGAGYPDGLRGEAIPLGARVVALGDVFDALISRRPYRPAASVEQARHMIELKAGVQFDPEMTPLFLSLPLEELIER